MYFKVVKNNKVIDVLDHLKYFKWQSKHQIMLLTDISDAQAVLSSDESTFWHTETLYKLPDDAPDLETVELIPIDEHEYRQFKALNGRTPQEIFDDTILYLIDNGLL